MIRLSATAMKDYVVCKSKMRYRRLKLRDLPINAAMAKGGAIHYAIELYEKEKISATQLPYAFQNSLLKRLKAPNVERWSRTDLILSSGYRMLENYLEHKQGDILGVEYDFKCELETSEGISYIVVGKIDQLVEMEDGLCIVDIKTSRKEPTIFEIIGDYQFSMYALAYAMEYGKLPPAVYNFHLGSGKYINYPRTGKDMSIFRRKMDEVIVELDSIKQWEEHHKDKGWHCNSCMYRNYCYDINRGMPTEF